MRIICFITGILLILLSLFARLIGMDHDTTWGTSRYLFLFTGLAFSISAALVHLHRLGKIPLALVRPFQAARRAVAGFFGIFFEKIWISIALAAIVLAAASVFAVWFTSYGLFPTFTQVANPYVDLGEAFLHGQVALLNEPDPRLVSLADPYDPIQRDTVPYIWDTSYYKGKYYIYWGPVPAVFNAVTQWFTRVRPPDQLGVLYAYILLGMILLLMFFKMRRWYAPHAPGISVVLLLQAAMVNMTYMFLLGRSQVYETSVITGQFFLVAGLFAWLAHLNSGKSFWLALAGLAWGLAIGSRYNLALAVGVFVFIALLWIWRSRGWTRPSFLRAASLLAPLALCGLALAFYNYIRFDSPFETGLKYQLTITVAQNGHFSPAYIPANLYMYLLYPLSTGPAFPYYPSIPVQYHLLPAWAAPTAGQCFDEVFIGALTGQPILWLLAMLAPFALIHGFKSTGPTGIAALPTVPRKASHAAPTLPNAVRKLAAVRPGSPRIRLAVVLSLAAFVQFVFLLFYYYGAMRFNADYFLLVLVAILLISWELDERLRGLPAFRALFWLAVALLVLFTTGPALLSGFDIPPQLFRGHNEVLFGQLARLADRVYKPLVALYESSGLVGMLLRLFINTIY